MIHHQFNDVGSRRPQNLFYLVINVIYQWLCEASLSPHTSTKIAGRVEMVFADHDNINTPRKKSLELVSPIAKKNEGERASGRG